MNWRMSMSKNDQKADLERLRKNLTADLWDVTDRKARQRLLNEVFNTFWNVSMLSYYPLVFRLKYFRLFFIVYDHLRRRRQMTRRVDPMDQEEVGPMLKLIDKLIDKQ